MTSEAPGRPNIIVGFWLLGVLGSIVGAAVAFSEDEVNMLGIGILAAAGVVLQLAVIATAVSLGMRDRDALMRQSSD